MSENAALNGIAREELSIKLEELSGKAEKALAVVYCAMDYACPPNDRHAPYLRPALSAAVDILEGLKRDMDKLTGETDED